MSPGSTLITTGVIMLVVGCIFASYYFLVKKDREIILPIGAFIVVLMLTIIGFTSGLKFII